MVFFTCNACGEALKKANVENHYTKQCRRCEMLSCVDCGKDFWGEDYKQHNKCISEEEKYSGKNFVATKVEGKKQHSWTEQVAGAIEKGLTRSHLKKYLIPMQQCDNIPRKKQKFENFMKNTAKLYNKDVLDEIWGLISEQAQKEPSSATTPVSSEDSADTKVNGTAEKENGEKKADKDEPKKRKLKKAKEASANEGSKSKKRKAEEDVGSGGEKKSKKSKEKTESDGNTPRDDDVDKFQWRAVITEAFSGKADNEMSIKKLRKKVIAKYLLQNKQAESSEKLIEKFHKKLSKHKTITVEGKKAKLIVT